MLHFALAEEDVGGAVSRTTGLAMIAVPSRSARALA